MNTVLTFPEISHQQSHQVSPCEIHESHENMKVWLNLSWYVQQLPQLQQVFCA